MRPQRHALTGLAICTGGWLWEQDSTVNTVSYMDAESTAMCAGFGTEQAIRRCPVFEPDVWRDSSGSILRMRGT